MMWRGEKTRKNAFFLPSLPKEAAAGDNAAEIRPIRRGVKTFERGGFFPKVIWNESMRFFFSFQEWETNGERRGGDVFLASF